MASDQSTENPRNVETTDEFRHFDVVPEIASDHHYFSTNNTTKSQNRFTCNGNPSLYKKIMQEWKVLEKNLPESIYVRVYETRIDLLRAVIIGSPDTPYNNGLFFFDIVLPSNYPNEPPKVHYRSHGYRLNPNLYNNGKVCLSLINTWAGRATERWSKTSTILQILVSIQGLVLNERPYFNEPGIASMKNTHSAPWVNSSLGYNYGVLVLSCKTMINIMKKPPEGFEGFVARHFKDRAKSILAFVEDYRNGRALAGQFPPNHPSANSTIKVSSVQKFKMRRIHSALEKAFTSLEEKKDSSSDNAVVKKPKGGNKGLLGLLSGIAKCFS